MYQIESFDGAQKDLRVLSMKGERGEKKERKKGVGSLKEGDIERACTAGLNVMS